MPDETLSPEQAQAQLDAFYNDPNRPWNTRTEEEGEQAKPRGRPTLAPTATKQK